MIRASLHLEWWYRLFGAFCRTAKWNPFELDGPECIRPSACRRPNRGRQSNVQISLQHHLFLCNVFLEIGFYQLKKKVIKKRTFSDRRYRQEWPILLELDLLLTAVWPAFIYKIRQKIVCLFSFSWLAKRNSNLPSFFYYVQLWCVDQIDGIWVLRCVPVFDWR